MALLSANMKVASSMRPAMRQAMALPMRRSVRPISVRASAQKPQVDAGFEAGKMMALTSVAGSWLVAGNANAATELMQMAANDNRFGILATLFVPVVGWVAYNILQPALSQLEKMDERRSVVGAVGVGAALSLLLADQASASTELMQMAESDNRVGILLTLFAPVVGWVAFNILQPALNQLERMDDARSVAGAVGLGGALSLLLAQNADAATEVMQMAESDNRVGILLTLFAPVVGWVAFNILQPALNQLERMDDARGVAGAVGLGGALSLLLVQNADAATEVLQMAESDNRVGIIATLFVPVVGWVAFNILQPALNQIDRMGGEDD